MNVAFSETFVVPKNATEVVNATALDIRLSTMVNGVEPLLDFTWNTVNFTSTEMTL